MTYNRFHDGDENGPETNRLRELHAAMDRAVLDGYGWADIPITCDFFGEHGLQLDATNERKAQCRLRWPNGVCNEVLGRLMDLNAKQAGEVDCGDYDLHRWWR